MERRCRFLFTICLIMGFQIHLPVTMFPANLHLNETTISNDTGWNNIGTSNPRGSDSPTTPETPHGSADRKEMNDGIVRVLVGDTPGHAGEYHPSKHRQLESVNSEGLISPHMGVYYQMNEDGNQVRRGDRSDPRNRKDLNGLATDLSTNSIKTSMVEPRRPPETVSQIKLEYVQEKIANISAKLSSKANLLPLNNSEAKTSHGQTVHKNKEQEKTNKTVKERSSNKTDYSHNLNTANGQYVHVKHKTKPTESPLINGIAWSSMLDHRCGQGYTQDDQERWKQKVARETIVKIEPGCGSMQNRLLTFNDTTQACVRYRLNSDLMQGEIYSFHLSKLLGMHYIPPTAMHKVSDSLQWERVRKDVEESKWSEHKPLIITQWVEALEPVYMPPELKDNKKLQPQFDGLRGSSLDDLCELVQWTDLIVFDYISANLDRVVNNMFSLKWNHKMLEKPIHNLHRSKETGRLVFLDNESGLFHGYRLLDSYGLFHQSLLDSVCVFRQSTIDAVKRLHAEDVGTILHDLYQSEEPYHSYLPRMSPKTMNTLSDRIKLVYEHIQNCKTKSSTLGNDK